MENVTVSPAGVWGAMLRHYREAADLSQDNVAAGLSGGFAIATLSEGQSVGYVDTAARGLVLDDPDAVSALSEIFESLLSDALPTRQSLEIIRKAVTERWT